MNRRIFAISAFCFLLFALGLFAQDTWIKTYQPFGDVDYYPEDIVVCSDSGYAVNGYYYYYDPEFGIEEEWGFLMKTDSDGNFLWANLDTLSFMFENQSYAFTETTEGDLISVGYSYSSGYMIKRDSDGNRIWAISYNDFGANSMCNTSDGNIILGGVVSSELALRKIDSNGNTIWTKAYNCGDVAIAKSIIQTNDGGYALTGYVSGNGYDIIVMKTDTNGDSLWTRTYDGYGGWDRGKSITEDSNNNILVAGSISAPGTTGFLWYLDEEGNTIWTEEVDGDVGYSHYSILSLPDNSFVAYCYKGNRESQIYDFNINYNIQWEGSILDGILGQGDGSLCSEGEYFLCLLSEVGGFMEDNIGIAKTDSQGQIVSIDNNEIPYIDDIILTNYPNPFNPKTKISFSLPVHIENPIIEIFNIKGEKVRVINCQNQMPIIWDGTDNFRNQMSSGIYFYRLKANNFVSKVNMMTLLK